MDYRVILTNTGKAKVAAALANNTTVKIKYIAFGDGGGMVMTPDASMTTLMREKYKTLLNSVSIHPASDNWVVCEGYIPKDVGEFWIREVGIYDEANELIAVGNYPETYKPTLTLGIGTDLKINVIFEVASASAITLIIDPSAIFATQAYVLEQIEKINVNTGVFAGMLAFSAFRSLPAGWARCDGMSVLNCDTALPDIWTQAIAGELPACTLAQYTAYLAANDGNCGFFGVDTTAKTLRLPLIKDGYGVMQALSSSEIGKWYRDALQNITGTFGKIDAWDNIYDNNPSGAFYSSAAGTTNGVKDGSSDPAVTVRFDASRVARTATETRNKHIRYPLIICLATSFTGDSSAAWNQLVGSLSGKANTDLSNISANIDYITSVATYSGSNSGSVGGTWQSEYRTWKSGRMEFLANVDYGSPTRSNPVFTFTFSIPFSIAPTKALISAKIADTAHPSVSCSYSSLTATAITVNSYGNGSSDNVLGVTIYISGQRS